MKARQLRAKGMSQERIAEQLGTTKSRIHRWIRLTFGDTQAARTSPAYWIAQGWDERAAASMARLAASPNFSTGGVHWKEPVRYDKRAS